MLLGVNDNIEGSSNNTGRRIAVRRVAVGTYIGYDHFM
jgi:hypothetical protein